MNSKITHNVTGEALDILVSASFIAGDDATINAADCEETPGYTFGDLDAGTMIHSPGYAVVKEKALDGSWAKL